MRHCQKSVRISSFFGPCFSAIGLDTQRYGVFLRIHSECEKILTRKTPDTDTFHAVRTMAKIYDHAFLEKKLAAKNYGKGYTIFAETFRHKYLTGS